MRLWNKAFHIISIVYGLKAGCYTLKQPELWGLKKQIKKKLQTYKQSSISFVTNSQDYLCNSRYKR